MAITIIGESPISVSWGSAVALKELHYCRDALLCIRHYKYIYLCGRLRRLPGDSLSRRLRLLVFQRKVKEPGIQFRVVVFVRML